MNQVTMVTAFFDIGREKNGDGRSVAEYLQWIQHTLQLNCNLYVVTEERFRDFFVKHRPARYPMHVEVIKFEDSHYYKFYDRIKGILQSSQYRLRVAHPNRVECVLPEYNIIQYSKFHYMKMAIEQNPFQSTSFFWMDAGLSRFFLDVDIQKPFPSPSVQQFLASNLGKFIVEKRHDLELVPIDDSFVWNAANLLKGGMFGGGKDVVLEIGKKVEDAFIQKMLNQGNVNNEQLALALVWKENPHLFITLPGVFGGHFSLFKLFAQ